MAKKLLALLLAALMLVSIVACGGKTDDNGDKGNNATDNGETTRDVVADFLDVAVFHIKDHSGIADSRQTMRDNKAGTSLHQGRHSVLDILLCMSVNVTCRFVEDHNFGIRDDSARDGEELSLTLRDILSALGEHHIVAAGHCADEVVGAD